MFDMLAMMGKDDTLAILHKITNFNGFEDVATGSFSD